MSVLHYEKKLPKITATQSPGLLLCAFTTTRLGTKCKAAKKRAAFNDIKQELYRKGVRFGLLHPARLRVTFEGETVYFDTPEAARAFYDRRIAG